MIKIGRLELVFRLRFLRRTRCRQQKPCDQEKALHQAKMPEIDHRAQVHAISPDLGMEVKQTCLESLNLLRSCFHAAPFLGKRTSRNKACSVIPTKLLFPSKAWVQPNP